jgi:hypothetical protein
LRLFQRLTAVRAQALGRIRGLSLLSQPFEPKTILLGGVAVFLSLFTVAQRLAV